jgi:cytochrome b561
MREEALRYHKVAMSLHWLMAVLILTNLAIGISFGFIEMGPTKFWLFQFHKSIGITVLLLTVVRIAWRLGAGAPAEPPMPAWQRWAANIVHFLLYFLMLAIPFTGWVMVSYSPLKLPTLLFWTIPWPHLPVLDPNADMKAVAGQAKLLHQYLAYSMIGLWLMHVGAALQHHFILKDTVILRMTPRFLEKTLRWVRGERA